MSEGRKPRIFRHVKRIDWISVRNEYSESGPIGDLIEKSAYDKGIEALKEARYEFWTISCAMKLPPGDRIQIENAYAAKRAVDICDKTLKELGEI